MCIKCVCVSLFVSKRFQQGPGLHSPWPTKLLMFGEDMQSDQLHVAARGDTFKCVPPVGLGCFSFLQAIHEC